MTNPVVRRVLLATSVIGLAAAAGIAAVGPGRISESDSPGPPPYDRDAFGQRWKDTDGNGCGQRDDVLARDLADVTRQGRCAVVSGSLVDPYTGGLARFTKAEAHLVHIDHVVALAEAWRSGAYRWSDDERERFANDLDNLLATTAGSNRSKGDDDPARWLPPSPARACAYVRHHEAVKDAYDLAADRAEVAAVEAVLEGCP